MEQRVFGLWFLLGACRRQLQARNRAAFDAAKRGVEFHSEWAVRTGNRELLEVCIALDQVLPTEPLGGPDADETERFLVALVDAEVPERVPRIQPVTKDPGPAEGWFTWDEMFDHIAWSIRFVFALIVIVVLGYLMVRVDQIASRLQPPAAEEVMPPRPEEFILPPPPPDIL